MRSRDTELPSDFRVWEGTFDDFPAEDPEGAFSTDRWVDKLADEARAALDALATDPAEAACSTVTLTHEYPLPVLAAIAASNVNRPLRILDFGGGMASSYAAVVGALPRSVTLDFHVVEGPALSERGRALFADRKDVSFHDELPASGRFDVVHAAASMQYVRDWQGLLKRFADYEPEWIAFGHLLAGPLETFVTSQNSYGKKIPVRFYNIKDFTRAVENLGYRLVYQALMVRTILGSSQPLPTAHFPDGKRLRYGCNLIFRRIGHGPNATGSM